MLTKQEILLEKGTRVESRREGNPGEQLCHMARSLRFSGDGISLWVFFSPSFWLSLLPGGAGLVQPRRTPERRILGGSRTCGVSFWPFLSPSGWRRLLVPCFLPGLPVLKQLMQIAAMVPGQGASLNKSTHQLKYACKVKERGQRGWRGSQGRRMRQRRRQGRRQKEVYLF